MIAPELAGSERQRLERVAEEYRSKGYEVLVEPSGSDLPSFLRDERPDLIARRGDERLVIELKPPSFRPELGKARRLVERIQKEPGWQLVLVALSPAEELLPGEPLSLLDSPEVEQHLAQARRLLDAGQPEAALLLAWGAVEARLRWLAKEGEIPLPRPGTLTLLRQLVSLGLIEREHYLALSDAFTARSAVAHGFKPQADIESTVHALLNLYKTLGS